MDADQFPQIPLDLLEELERLYPEKAVMPGQAMDELMHYGGQRSLVKWLREVHTAQNSEGEPVADEPLQDGDSLF